MLTDLSIARGEKIAKADTVTSRPELVNEHFRKIRVPERP
jgi:hypothetical protein